MPALDPDGLSRLLSREPLLSLAEVAREHPARVALVGGAVRDAFLGREIDDLDLVVEDQLADFVSAVAVRLRRRPVSIGDRFQDTHRVHVRGMQIDIARSVGALEVDLGRRDFTINSLAVVIPGDGNALLDMHGGLDDLESGVVRETAPGVLAADPVRLLRGVRYCTTLSGFHVDAATRARITALARALDQVAGERIQYELSRVLTAARWRDGLRLATELDLVGALFETRPEWEAVAAWSAAEASATQGSHDDLTRLAACVLDLAGEAGMAGIATVEKRLTALRWPKRPARAAVRIARWVRRMASAGESELASWALEDADGAERAARLGGALAVQRDAFRAAADRLAEFASHAREPRWVEGADLRRWGVPAGQALGELLTEAWTGQLLRRWASPDACRSWVRHHIGEA
jgi:tRNA nucleotidyltransferase/poly(A) polymerase